MAKFDVISAPEARLHVQSGESLFVCAHGNEEELEAACLEGAMPLEEFKKKEDEIARDREIIFYCTDQSNASSTIIAETYADKGFTNVKVLDAGTGAWRDEGFPFRP